MCDYAKPGKTSGGARWNYLAAWAYAKEVNITGDEDKIKEFIGDLYKATYLSLMPEPEVQQLHFVETDRGDVLDRLGK